MKTAHVRVVALVLLLLVANDELLVLSARVRTHSRHRLSLLHQTQTHNEPDATDATASGEEDEDTIGLPSSDDALLSKEVVNPALFTPLVKQETTTVQSVERAYALTDEEVALYRAIEEEKKKLGEGYVKPFKVLYGSKFETSKPKLFELKDLRKINGRTGKTTTATEVVTISFTNNEILDGGELTDLKTNWEHFHALKPHLFTEDEAKKLDGVSKLAPLERSAMDHANKMLRLGDVDPNDIDIKVVWEKMCDKYARSFAKTEAEELMGAFFYRWGTNEEAVYRVLGGKCACERKALAFEFGKLWCAKKGDDDRMCRGMPSPVVLRSRLLYAIRDEMSLGEEEKAIDLYYNRGKEDHEYFWFDKMAKTVNDWVKKADRATQEWAKDDDDWLALAAGHIAQAGFAVVSGVNGALSDASAYWLKSIEASDNGWAKTGATAMFLLAEVGGALTSPLQAIDPDLPYTDTKDAMLDIFITIGTFGAGKLAAVAAKTAVGARVLVKLNKAARKFKGAMFSLTRAIRKSGGMSKATTTFGKRASKYRQVAARTSGSRARNARAAAERLEKCKFLAEDVAAHADSARDLKKRAQAAFKAGNRAQGEQLMDKAASVAEVGARKLEFLSKYQALALKAEQRSGILHNTAIVGHVTRRAVGGGKKLGSEILTGAKEEIRDQALAYGSANTQEQIEAEKRARDKLVRDAAAVGLSPGQTEQEQAEADMVRQLQQDE